MLMSLKELFSVRRSTLPYARICMQNAFQAFQAGLLQTHELAFPDGRPLYRYRLVDQQFVALEVFLREKIRRYLAVGNFGDIVGDVPGFPPLFVMYASEWWRRRYDGTGWSWEPIMRDLGAPSDAWNPTQRSECVSRGLQQWGLELNGSAGYVYLGTIALQGGLPMRLLAEAHGALGNVLVQVLRLASAGAAAADIKGWVASLSSLLPRTYRNDEIYTLLADVIVAVLRLKEDAQLSDAETAISTLDSRIPEWRDRFPLPVEAQQAKGLIERLVKGAIAVPAIRSSVVLPVRRTLESTGDSCWEIQSTIEMPTSLVSDSLAKLFNVSPSELPRSGELTLTAGSANIRTALRKGFGQNAFRIDPRPWVVSGPSASEEHTLSLSSGNGDSWHTHAAKGEQVDRDLPWVFEELSSRLCLTRQGSGGAASPEAVIVAPAGMGIHPQGDSSCVAIGVLQNSDHLVYRVRGAVRIGMDDQLQFRITTGQANAREEHFEWKAPERLWGLFPQSELAFKGKPHLYVLRGEGVPERVQGSIAWRALGGGPLGQPNGPVEARYPATGPVQHRARMVLLHESASIKLQLSDRSKALVFLNNWGAIHADCVTPDVVATAQLNNGVLTVAVESTDQIPPEWLELDVVWPASTRKVRVRLPYPVEGLRAFDRLNRELRSNDIVSVGRLAGARILALIGGGATGLSIKLELRATDGHDRFIERRINAESGALRVEIRLQDYAEDIQRLLTTSEEHDAYVVATVRANRSDFKIRISRYAAVLQRNGPAIQLDTRAMAALNAEELGQLTAKAIRLDSAADGSTTLPLVLSEGVATGSWAFRPEQREPGAWLIFPDESCAHSFRPALWVVAGGVSQGSRLADAIAKDDPREREDALDVVVSLLAQDYMAPEWRDLERLASEVGYLPLQALDLWRRMARSADAMAALAFRLSAIQTDFILRFGIELPFMWELVPYRAWRTAMHSLIEQCREKLGEGWRNVARSALSSRVDGLTARYPTIYQLLHIAKAEALGEDSTKIARLRDPASASAFSSALFDGADSLVQRLMQIHTDESWPTDFHYWAAEARNDSMIVQLMNPGEPSYRDSVVNLPIILAAHGMRDSIDSRLLSADNIYSIRGHQSFDQDWFTEAYNYTVLRCLGLGLTQEAN